MTGTLKMKTLIVLIGLAGAAVCWVPQPVQDTPEVAAAKAAHLAALAKAKQEALDNTRPVTQQIWNVDKNTIMKETWNNQWSGNNGLEQWNQVADTAQKDDDGSWKDDGSWQNYDDGSWKESETTEAPKADNKWASIGEPSKWTGPIALPPGYDESGAPLPVEDTPEVAAAKAKHLEAYVRAAAKTAPAAHAIPVASQRPTATPLRPALQNSLTRPALQNSLTRPALQNSLTRPALQNSLTRPALQNSLTRPALPNTRPTRPALPPSLQAQRVVPKDPAPIYEQEGVVDTPEVAAAKAAHFAAHAKRRLQ